MSLCDRTAALRRVWSMLILGAVTTACGGGGDGPVGTGVPVPTTITVATPSVTLQSIAATSATSVTVRDADGAVIAAPSITWSSDAPSVASVAGTGTGSAATITATGRGVAVITARSGAIATSTTVFVRSAFAVSVSPSQGAIRVGATLPLQALVSADEGAATTVTWTSDTPAIATVSSQGLVTGITLGTVSITARSTSDTRLSASASVTIAPARALVLSPVEMNIGRADARALQAQVFLDAGQSTAVLWRTNRPLIATVTQQGVVTGVSDGDATITAVSAADTTLRSTATVHVVPIVRSITLSATASLLNIGQTQTFVATVIADQGVAKTIAWSSSDPAVASVSATGVTTAIGVGSAVIRARAVSDSTREATVTVTVAARPVALTLGVRTVGLTIGRTTNVSAIVSGDPGISTSVLWQSRNPAVASVNAAGELTGVGAGATWIVAQAIADMSQRDSVRATVVPQLAASWSTTRLGGPLIEDIRSLWSLNSTLAYAVNSLGDVYRWNGTEWLVSARGSTFGTSFVAVHGVSASAVTAVGTNGVIARFNGTTWTASASGVSAALSDVWMHSADTAWAVGANGVTLRLLNGAWSAGTSGTTRSLRAVWGSGNLAFAVGDSGVVRRWQSGGWGAVTSGVTETLRDVWSAGNGTVYAVGDFGQIIHWNGSAFVTEASGTSATLHAISGSANGSLYAAGDGVVVSKTTGSWLEATPPYSTRFGAAAVDQDGRLWVGGQRGLVLYLGGQSSWSTLSLTPDLLDVWSSSATHALAVGELGFIFRYNGSTWARQAAPTLERLNTVWAASTNVAFAGGDNGVLLRWNGSTWARQTSPTGDHIYAMWGASDAAVWAVTDGGHVLFWNGSTWAVVHTQALPLYAVYGTSAQDVHIAGLSGTAAHWNGATWTTRPTGGDPVLVGLWAADAQTSLAVGARDFSSGVALRYGGTWSEQTTGTSNILSAVWGAVGFDLYAVGDLGTIIRYNGTGWLPMNSGTTEFLWAVSGSPDGTGAGFAVGLNGVVVQAGSAGSALASSAMASSAMASSALVRSGSATRERAVRDMRISGSARDRDAGPIGSRGLPTGDARRARGRR